MAQEGDKYSSVKTFYGVRNQIKKQQPAWFILENVELGGESEIDDTSSNLGLIVEALREIGYYVRVELTAANATH